MSLRKPALLQILRHNHCLYFLLIRVLLHMFFSLPVSIRTVQSDYIVTALSRVQIIWPTTWREYWCCLEYLSLPSGIYRCCQWNIYIVQIFGKTFLYDWNNRCSGWTNKSVCEADFVLIVIYVQRAWWMPVMTYCTSINVCRLLISRRQYPQCVSNGGTAVLHWAIDMLLSDNILTKWPPICKRHFHSYFQVWWSLLHCGSIFTEHSYQGFRLPINHNWFRWRVDTKRYLNHYI